MEFIYSRAEVSITDKSFQTPTSAPSSMRAFQPLISEKGVDNKIQHISGSTLISKYGTPNFKLHGQSIYNAANTLLSGGSVFAMRLLPENATYSHAIVNIQTKVSKQSKKNINGELVDVDKVQLRPVIMHLNNANTMSSLGTALTHKYEGTIDGFENNPFLAIVPEGRGKYYDRYSFKISPSTVYDETYDGFRLYLFETLETNNNGSTSVIEGPFYISLDPNAISLDRESLFIGNVLERYSNVFRAEFNETNYTKILTTINPIRPTSVDLLFGQTRLISDKPETFFNPITKMDEDIHMSLFLYDENGEVVTDENGKPVLNFIKISEIQSTILDVDDTMRRDKYTSASNGVTTMLLALSRYKAKSYKEFTEEYVVYDDNQIVTGGKMKPAMDKTASDYAALEAAKLAYETDDTEENQLELLRRIDIYMDSIKLVRDINIDLIYISKVVGSTTNLLDAVVELVKLNNILANYDIMKVNIATNMDQLLDLMKLIVDTAIIPTSTAKLSNINKALVDSQELLRFMVAMDTDGSSIADSDITLSLLMYEDASKAYEDAIDEYLIPSELDEHVKDALDKTSALLDQIKKTLDLIMIEQSLLSTEDANGTIDRLTLETVQAVKDSNNTVETSYQTPEAMDAMVETMKTNIDSARADVKILSLSRYIQDLRDISSMVPLILGSDGDLDKGSPADRARVIKNLFIMAFKGVIDEDILDEERIEFDYIMDANYDFDIKNAIITLTTQAREDSFAFLDLGIVPSPQHAIDRRKQDLFVSNRNIAIYGQDFTVYDEFTSSDIRVTTPYFLSSMVPNNVSRYGLHQPLAGPLRGTVSQYKHISYIPRKEYKNELYKNQVNYVETVRDITNLGSQLTSQRRNSALSNINNVLVLQRLRRRVKDVTNMHRIQLVDEENLRSLNSDLSLLVSEEMQSGAYKSIDVTASASDYDLAKKQYRVEFEVVFKDIMETIISNITVTL